MSMLQLISDEPCLDIEHLPERKRLIEQIAHAVANSDPPLVVGVHGDWGSGKTSFLHALQYHLSGRCPQNPAAGEGGVAHPHIVPIWFEAWRYQHESAPVVALLHEIRSQLSFGQKFLTSAGKMSEVAIRGALMSIEDVTKKIGFQASKIQEAGEAWERENLATALPSAQLREFLDEALGKLLGEEEDSGKDRRLVVFIDDLDRCEPETAYRLLESLKVYLNLRRCVFVLGLNQREVERALAKVMPSNRNGSADLMIRAHEYLEKICANVWHLPLVSPAAQETLLREWLGDQLDDEFIEAVIALLHAHQFLPANARRIKAFANALLRLYQSGVNDETSTAPSSSDAPLMCIIACLQQFHPRLWRHVESEPGFFFELHGFARGSDKKARLGPGQIYENSYLHPELAALELPGEGKVGQQGSVEFETRFTDLAYGNVLHCQRLVANAGVNLNDLKTFLGH
ncbi:KAP family P-loop NTPase fold protein [Haloferula sargassicola]|uniref:KAP NTPase domain-containing protein n=1 Tax=Haloferula sargassicola TaxID=490096 RepID=A0ABP9UTQ7_9BACT